MAFGSLTDQAESSDEVGSGNTQGSCAVLPQSVSNALCQDMVKQIVSKKRKKDTPIKYRSASACFGHAVLPGDEERGARHVLHARSACCYHAVLTRQKRSPRKSTRRRSCLCGMCLCRGGTDEREREILVSSSFSCQDDLSSD